MPYELLIGTRHLRSTHRRGFVSFVALISVMGLTLGVATLVVVLSVMNGFERELRSRILSVTSHAMLMGIHGSIDGWREVQQAVQREPGVIAAAPYIEAQALIANKKRVKGAMVRGVMPVEEMRTTSIGQHLSGGSLSDLKEGAYNVILGANLAKELRVGVGDDVVIIAPCGFDLPRTEGELHWHDWSALPGRVYLADGNAYFNRPGPRVVETFEIIEEILHPDVAPRHRGRGWRCYDELGRWR